MNMNFTNQLQKLIKQKNTLLCLATCIALSSITLQCDSCEYQPEENKVTIDLTPSSDIKGDEVATITLDLKEGYLRYSDVSLVFDNYAAFVKADGTPLAKKMTLHTFLGKSANAEITDPTIALKVKASKQTQKANKDEKLQLAVGNDKDANAYVSERDVVTWKATPTPPPTTAFTMIPDKTEIYGNDVVTVTITKNSGSPKNKEVHFTFIEHASFVLASGTPLSPNMTLDELTGGGAEDFVGDTPIELKFKRVPGLGTETTLKAKIGSISGGADLLPEQNVVTWKATGPTTLAFSITASTTEIKDDEEATLTLTKTSGSGKQRDVHFTFTEHASFVLASSTTLSANMTLDQLTGKDPDADVDPSTVLIFKRVATLAAETTLSVKIGSTVGGDDFLPEKNVVTWKATAVTPLVFTITTSPITAEIKADEEATLTLTKTSGDAKQKDVHFTFTEHACFALPAGVVLSKNMTLNQLTGKDPDAAVEGDTKIKFKRNGTIPTNTTLKAKIGSTTNGAEYGNVDVVTWKGTMLMTITDAINIDGNGVAKITLTNTGDPVRYGEVLLTFGGNTDSFEAVHDDSIFFNKLYKLNEFFSSGGFDANYVLNSDDPIDIEVKATEPTKTANNDATLTLAVGNDANPSAYLPAKAVVTWKKQEQKISCKTLLHPPKGQSKEYLEITLTNEGPNSLKCKDLILDLQGFDNDNLMFVNINGAKYNDQQKNNLSLDAICSDTSDFAQGSTKTLYVMPIKKVEGSSILNFEIKLKSNNEVCFQRQTLWTISQAGKKRTSVAG